MGNALAILSNPSVVAAVCGILGWIWHRGATAATNRSAALAHALHATRSVASGLVATIAPTATPDELAAKVVQAGYALLKHAGYDPASLPPVAVAALNAAAHGAVAEFATRATTEAAPASDALHAALVQLSKQPPATS